MGKIKLQKIVWNLLDKLRKLYRNGTVIQKFVAFLKLQLENSRQFLFLDRTDISQKTAVGCPCIKPVHLFVAAPGKGPAKLFVIPSTSLHRGLLYRYYCIFRGPIWCQFFFGKQSLIFGEKDYSFSFFEESARQTSVSTV